MIQPLDPGAAEGLPSGLCTCRLGGMEMYMAALSPRSVWLYTPEANLPAGVLTLCLYRPETGDYELHTLSEYKTGPVQRMNGAVLTRLSFEDAACAAAVRRTLDGYARYLEIKSEEGAAAYAAHVSGYPEEADEIFPESLARWRRECFSHLAALPQIPNSCSLAVELNCPELRQLYLRLPLDEFMAAYAERRGIPSGWLPARLPDRLYIGNAYCRHLFPDEEELRAIAAKARREGLQISLVTAELRSRSTALAERQLAFAAEMNAELIANDWGMLERACGQLAPGQLVLGTQLNRRRKDPRMAYKLGTEGRESLLARNNLNDPGWFAFLHSLGIERFEFESCGLAMEIPEGSHSLHFPFYQTNTSLWCPLRALCLHGDRGMQADAQQCPHFCENNALLYPAHLKMLGRWNSLLALDEGISALFGPARFDRWVLNF